MVAKWCPWPFHKANADASLGGQKNATVPSAMQLPSADREPSARNTQTPSAAHLNEHRSLLARSCSQISHETLQELIRPILAMICEKSNEQCAEWLESHEAELAEKWSAQVYARLRCILCIFVLVNSLFECRSLRRSTWLARRTPQVCRMSLNCKPTATAGGSSLRTLSVQTLCFGIECNGGGCL